MVKCSACGRFLSSTASDAVCCKICTLNYHRACVALALGSEVAPDWNCPECKKDLRQIKGSETPVKGLSSMSAESLVGNSERHNAVVASDELEGGLAVELRLFREEIRAMRADFQDFRKEINDMKSSLSLCTQRLNILDSKVELLEKNTINAQPGSDLTKLECTVAQLKSDMNERDQELLSNDIEITNITEMPGENLMNLLSLVASKMNVKLEERDVISMSRVGGHLRADSPQGPALVRPRPIAVRLSNATLKSELLRSARVRRGATTADLGVSAAPRRFYINERLTKQNRVLFRQARDAGRGHNWRFVWTKRGRIFARRDEESMVYHIKSEEDIDKFILRNEAGKK